MWRGLYARVSTMLSCPTETRKRGFIPSSKRRGFAQKVAFVPECPLLLKEGWLRDQEKSRKAPNSRRRARSASATALQHEEWFV